MPAPILILAPFVILLLLAAGWDIVSYTIPNAISAVLLAAFALFAFAVGYSAGQWESHAMAAAIGLVIGFLLFAFGWIGGGDAKLIACIAAWFGLQDFPEYLLVASVFGGALTLMLITARRWPLPATLAGHDWIRRLHEPRGGIPYGVALAAGALAILPYTDLFRTVSA
jgi:prepilin peptidase CpaA